MEATDSFLVHTSLMAQNMQDPKYANMQARNRIPFPLQMAQVRKAIFIPTFHS